MERPQMSAQIGAGCPSRWCPHSARLLAHEAAGDDDFAVVPCQVILSVVKAAETMSDFTAFLRRGMQCTVAGAVVFVLCSLIYGSSFAGNTQGLKYFSPGLFIAFRMLFGALSCVVIMLFRMCIQHGYRQIVHAHFTSVRNFLWMTLAGLLFHGIPHCLIAFAQKWVSSASVQIAQPITTCAGAIFAHFVIPEERFTWPKFFSLLCALLGVAIPAIPQFRRASNEGSATNMAVGYVLLIVSVVSFGIAAGIMRWKTPNVDVTVSTMVHTAMSFILCLIVALAWDTPKKVGTQCGDAPPIAWLWPVIVGILGTGLAGHGFVFLVSVLGATGASFITVGQVLVGVILGVAILHEWSGYKVWEIVLSVIGILFLGASIGIGFYNPKKKIAEEEEEKKEEEGTPARPEEGIREEGYDDKKEHEIVEL